MCLPPGLLRVEMRGSRPALVHYVEESRSASRPFQAARSPRETVLEVRPGCTPLLPGHASTIRSPWVASSDPTTTSRKRLWFFGIKIGRPQIAKKNATCDEAEDTASLLDMLLHKITHLIGLKAEREREIGHLKKQLMEERRQVPGEISHLGGYSRRQSVDQPSIHGSRRRSSSSRRNRSGGEPKSPCTVAAPPATPANWQYPYGCQVPQMAVAGRVHSRKRYRRSISEHNAKYGTKERKPSRDEGQLLQSCVMSREESSQTTVMTAVEERSFTTALTRSHDVQFEDCLVQQEEAKEEPGKESLVREGSAHISKETGMCQLAREFRENEAREMEQRIKDAPDLATGLGIFMEAVGGHVAHVNQQNKASELAVRSLDEKLCKIGRAYGELENRLNATVDSQSHNINAIGTQADGLRNDMNAIVLDLKSAKTAGEIREETKKALRRQRLDLERSWAADEAQRSWFSEL